MSCRWNGLHGTLHATKCSISIARRLPTDSSMRDREATMAWSAMPLPQNAPPRLLPLLPAPQQRRRCKRPDFTMAPGGARNVENITVQSIGRSRAPAMASALTDTARVWIRTGDPTNLPGWCGISRRRQIASRESPHSLFPIVVNYAFKERAIYSSVCEGFCHGYDAPDRGTHRMGTIQAGALVRSREHGCPGK